MAPLTINDIRRAAAAVAQALSTNTDRFTELDQAVGDGDLGVTITKVAAALKDQADTTHEGDLGTYLTQAGMAVNRAAPSTMGTLIATALLRAGKVLTGKNQATDTDIAATLQAAAQGIRDRGKANIGDKTILDALAPSADAFAAAIGAGRDRKSATHEALKAARAGRDTVTPKTSRIGRASWIGERTQGKVDPGCEVWVTTLAALAEAS